MTRVAFSIDYEAPYCWDTVKFRKAEGHFAPELIETFKEKNVPVTWFMQHTKNEENLKFFFEKVRPTIGEGDEIALHVHLDWLEDNKNPEVRRAGLRDGHATLAKRGITPTSYRGGVIHYEDCDTKFLEELGIVADSTAHASKVQSREPYHPDYEDHTRPGASKIVRLPIADAPGCFGYLDAGPENILTVLKANWGKVENITIGAHDYVENAVPAAQAALDFLAGKEVEYVTLTRMAEAFRSAS